MRTSFLTKIFQITALLLPIMGGLFIVTHQDRSTTQANTSIRIIDEDGFAIGKQEVRVLCYFDPVSGAPIADLTRQTDEAGKLQNLPDNCRFVAVLRLVHTQPSSKGNDRPAYWIYEKSWESGSLKPQTAQGDIVIDDANTLVLFNVVVSMTWQPSMESTFHEEFMTGMRSASELLFDATEGRAAFGPVTIFTNGNSWNEADIRITADNSFRPAAFVGGIVGESVEYTASKSTVYEPAAIYLGPSWDGTGATSVSGGAWDQPAGYRTIVHEWAHYGLFLYDEYIQTNAGSTYCTCRNLPVSGCGFGARDGSLMAYHYSADEFWHDIHSPIELTCFNSHQFHFHGNNDWRTLANWNDIQGVALAGGLEPFPNPSTLSSAVSFYGITADLFGRMPGHSLWLPVVGAPSLSSPSYFDGVLDVFVVDAAGMEDGLQTSVYVFEGDPEHPDRIVPYGMVIPDPDTFINRYGQAPLRGLNGEQHVYVNLERYTTESGVSGGRQVYPAPGDIGNQLDMFNEFEAQESEWIINLDVAQELDLNGLIAIKVQIESVSHSLSDGGLTAQFCSLDRSIGCDPHWQTTPAAMDETNTVWETIFTIRPNDTTFPNYGVIRVSSNEGLGQVVTWFQQLGGVGPGHISGDAPLRDGRLMVDTAGDIPSPEACNHAIVTQAVNSDALNASLETDGQLISIGGLVGPPLDVSILLANKDGSCQDEYGSDSLPVDVVLTLFYTQELIDLAGIAESFDLRLLHFSEDNNTWSEVLATSGQDTNHNWQSRMISEDGIYAIGWVAP